MNALVSASRTSRQVPVSFHSSVCSIVIGAALWAMTLRAEGHDLIHGHRFTAGETKRKRLARLMTGTARQRAVSKLEAPMEFFELPGASRRFTDIDPRMACFAEDPSAGAGWRERIRLDG